MAAKQQRRRSAAFRPSAEFEAKYELGRLLGEGGFGSVYLCTERSTGKQVACKVLNREYVRRTIGVEPSKEVGIMQQLAGRHYGVIQLLDSLEDDVNACAVMEYCAGGTLLEVLKTHGAMPEKGARVVLGQVAAALAFCHSERVLHLDIKPENIFFCEHAVDALYYSPPSSPLSLSSLFSSLDVRARLADFGMATVLRPGRKVRGDVGSPHFKAPEIVAGSKFGLEVDVWSLGVVLCVMLTGTVPFLGTTNHDQEGLSRAILSARIDFGTPRWWKVSAEAQDLVRRMLELNPSKRITAAQVLEHPWFKSSEGGGLEEEILPAIARDRRKELSSKTAARHKAAPTAVKRSTVKRSEVATVARAKAPGLVCSTKALRAPLGCPLPAVNNLHLARIACI